MPHRSFMPKFLLVKTSSLGDVVHNLPVASDLVAAFPGAQVDWVVEEAFVTVPRLHRQVSTVIPVAVRRWRKAPWRLQARREMSVFVSALRRERYDAVIDTQGLLKSALIARVARGRRYGLDWESSREPLRLFYDRTFHVPWNHHAVARNRSLAAQAFGYPVSEVADFGVTAQPLAASWLAPGYGVLLHATSADVKLWPDANWAALCDALGDTELQWILPWGSRVEQLRSGRLAAAIRNSMVPSRLTLDEVAGLLAGAQVVVGVDTGLTHLAAALGVPTVGVYCATDPAATGVYPAAGTENLGGRNAPPAAAHVAVAVKRLLIKSGGAG